MRLRYTPRATADLNSIFAYIDEHSPAGAIHVKARIQQLVEGLTDFPFAGREAGFRNVRMLVAGRFPYLIFYRVVEDEVQIIHVPACSPEAVEGLGTRSDSVG